ncbi:MAG: aminomethyl-transferring glycine dehydrogenase subunit GcvPB, partial [Chloroflexi bacterium]|nr:aminomethyl-transferring glycine dehydrogenase subunit GcvPB [Chloroflexota bacterium]
RAAGLHVGVDITGRTPCHCSLLKISFSDLQASADTDKLVAFFEGLYGKSAGTKTLAEIPAKLLRQGAVGLPSFTLSELKAYYSKLGELNVSPDTGCFPLGSCTMKYNPHINDWAAGLPGFTGLHPQAPAEDAQGPLELLWQTQEWFRKITGLAGLTTQPVAGAQGELVGLKLFQAYHRHHGQHRDIILIPSSAHGTNFATATTAGYATKRNPDGSPSGIMLLKSAPDGRVDQADFAAKIAEFGPRIAGMMVTNPNTSGVFETDFQKMASEIHRVGGLVYMDGANMNAQVGLSQPGAFGADVCHLNLHKTFAIPHGGGGPGMGPIGVAQHLAPFLPGRALGEEGRVSSAPYGSASILPISWAYIAALGAEGIRSATEIAILNANYMAARLRSDFPILYTGRTGTVAHECILDVRAITEESGVTVEDIAKRLMDFGFHAPTMSWPVAGTLMLEPTESESKAELDRYVDALREIRAEIREIAAGKTPVEQSALRNAPHTASDLLRSDWARPYSREQGAFPLPWVKARKYWPPVRRIDNVHGDRNVVCACLPVDAYAAASGETALLGATS